ncbi:hypothetical protein Pmar_PMAR001393, partial [Perkinsus marinus ATCC 50983]
MKSSSSSQLPRRSSERDTHRSASTPPLTKFSKSDAEHAELTPSHSLPLRSRLIRSESAIESGRSAVPAESSPGGRRPWHRRAREISATHEKLTRRRGERAEPQPREFLGEPVAHRQEGVQEPPEAMWSTTPARPMIQPAAPQVGIGPSSSSSSQGPLDQPVPSISPGRTQPRVQVAYLRQGVLQQLRERGYVPSAEADGGVSSMAVEQIRRYVPVDGSLGSLLHNAQGHQCAPCLFHAKRRCLRGIKCL